MLVYGRISMKTELVEGVVWCFADELFQQRPVLICITQDIRYHKTGQPINQ